MRDRRETNQYAVNAVAEGVRTVKNHAVSINGRKYSGDCLSTLEGQKVHIRVRDVYASIYSVYDMNWKDLGECEEMT